jgi:hypothetical protein
LTTTEGRPFTVEIPPQADPQIGRERILVHFDDGRTEELCLHDYDRVYALPGLYEEVVQRRLGCRSPEESGSMLAGATDSLGWERSQVRVLDIGAGNGISGGPGRAGDAPGDRHRPGTGRPRGRAARSTGRL